MARPVDQQGYAPTEKVAAGGAGGAAALVVVFVAAQFGLDVPPEVASAFTFLVALAASYFKREKEQPNAG